MDSPPKITLQLIVDYTLRENCANTEFFWSVFSYIQIEYAREKNPYLDTFRAV